MKEIFDFKRFGKYFTSDLRSCVASYGSSLALICLLGTIMYIGTILMGLLLHDTWGGPEIEFRKSVFWFSMFLLAVTMPVKCYGRLTEKNVGSQWLMIPSSKLEKFLSMVLMTVLVTPVTVIGVSFGLDAFLCAVDPTCGYSIVRAFISPEVLATAYENSTPDFGQNMNSIILLALSFLLGAIFFKGSKTVRTFMVLFAVVAVAMILVMSVTFNEINLFELIENEDVAEDITIENIFGRYGFLHVIGCIFPYAFLLAGIFFRIKTLKH